MYSCHSIPECCNLFSGVKLSIRSFCFTAGSSEAQVRPYGTIYVIPTQSFVCKLFVGQFQLFIVFFQFVSHPFLQVACIICKFGKV